MAVRDPELVEREMKFTKEVLFAGDVTVSGTLTPGGGTTPADSSVTTAKLANALADRLIAVTVTAAAEADNKRVLSIQAKDVQGNNLAAATRFWLQALSAADASFAFSDDGAGSIVIEDETTALIVTDSTGLAEIGITDTAAETVVVGIGAGPGTGFVEGTTVSLEFT